MGVPAHFQQLLDFTLWSAAWAQANPAAQAKLERAQRSYNETSRGWDSPPAQRDLVGQI